ncbi:fungal-specific transcription factor domain-containing protein [Mycena crocata]|nr:fungal-specific transcription factor domain-containing protein [Mycena crocata]
MSASDPLSSAELRNKDGSMSKMRAHKGNIPTLPQTKACHLCSAKFTRSTHLTRHLKTHSNERLHRCTTCHAQFTRSDLLARHRKSCEDPSRPHRLRSCILCTESKVRCDRNDPCTRCKTKGRECLFAITPKKTSPPIAPPSNASPSDVLSTASTSRSSSSVEIPSSEIAVPDFLPLDSLNSLSTELADIHTETPFQDLIPPASSLVNSHLSPMFENDVFQPLFTDLFSNSPPSSTSLDEFPLSFPLLDKIPQQTTPWPPWFQELLIWPQSCYPPGDGEQLSLLNAFFTRDLTAADPKHYLYLFFNAFLAQMPVVHSSSFKFEGKPPYLVHALKCCGALFVRTRKAANYITETLALAREGLAEAFTQSSMGTKEQVYLVLAVVLLQTIGLFHQKPEERSKSSLYHAMLVTHIRRTGLISKNSSWTPTNSSGEVMWHDWIFYEMTKRALLLSYLHDCCQSIYFGLPSSFHPGEMTLRLPCEEALWRAGTAEEWFSILKTYESPQPRLTGPDYSSTFASMVNPQFLPGSALSPFSHFVLIHAILRDLFTACSEAVSLAADPSRRLAEEGTEVLIAVQYALHNWLHSWRSSHAGHQQMADEPSFMGNALPFYWLGQVALLAQSEALPPFNSADNVTGEIRFKLVKRWLKRIRAFLTENDGASTLFWDELMKIRLKTWQLEYESDGGADDQDGLLGFFPEL